MTKKEDFETYPQVKRADLQAATILPSGQTEQYLGSVKTPGIKMYHTPKGLLVEYHHKKAFIPETNVKIMEYLD